MHCARLVKPAAFLAHRLAGVDRVAVCIGRALSAVAARHAWDPLTAAPATPCCQVQETMNVLSMMENKTAVLASASNTLAANPQGACKALAKGYS